MIKSLATKYRPKSFDEMVGQRLNAVVLTQMVTNGSVPNALLFDGPRGTGKTSAARILAMELNPMEKENILNGTSLAVLEIDAASHGAVADIRSLTEQLRYSVGAEHRVVILDEAHSISREGFNALLKTLEEPPENVVFVLVTTEPQKLPDTILSRLMEFEFRRVTPEELLARIVAVATSEGISIEHDLAVKLAEDADGDVRDAIKNLDFVNRADILSVQKFIELTGEKDVGPLLFAALLTNDHAKIFGVLDHLMLEVGDARVLSDALNDLITDIFILKSNGHVKAAGRALDYRLKLAKLVESDRLYSAVQILWELKTKVRQVEDQRAMLSMALVLVADKLTGGKTPVSKSPTSTPEPVVASEVSAPRTLSLSELQQD